MVLPASPSRDALLAILRATTGLGEHARRHPLDYARWTIPQRAYLASTAKRKMIRLGNRGGKSYVALADVALRARKAHPFRPDWNARRGPVHQWIVTVSWAQSVPLMRIFREFLGEGDLLKCPNWDAAKGWGKDAPTLVFRDGSTVGWRTMRQGPLAHAGAELDHILVDEPCAIEHYRELERRVVSRAGELSLALTPVNAPGPLDWLRDLATEGIVQDLHFPMTEDLFRYDDGSLRTLPDGTPCDKAWIEEQARAVPARWREIVLHGGWDEIVTDGAFTDTFSPSKHVHTFRLDGRETLVLGIDHGTRSFSETAVLCAVDETTEYPSIYVIDCYSAPENTPPEEDARAILAMLRTHGIEWKRLRRVTGDIAHYGGRGKINRKSNKDLAYELAREMRLSRNDALSPPIWTAKTGAGSSPRGSVYRRISWLHRALLRDGQLTIHPRCSALVEAFEKFRGGSEDPHGHLIDALSYSLDAYINKGQTRNTVAPTVRIG